MQACAPLLDAAPSPSVVLFSGGGATGPFPRYSAYALAKVATVRLAENLAAEEPGWRVNAVAPGFVATGMHETTLALERERRRALLRGDRAPPGRRDPAEVAAGLVAFLLSDEARRHQRAPDQRRLGPVATTRPAARCCAARTTSAACAGSTPSASTTPARRGPQR